VTAPGVCTRRFTLRGSILLVVMLKTGLDVIWLRRLIVSVLLLIVELPASAASIATRDSIDGNTTRVFLLIGNLRVIPHPY